MTHRDRVLEAFSFQEPDRVPRNLHLVKAQVEEFRSRTGREDYREYWDLDLRWVGFRPPKIDWEKRFGGYYADEDRPYVFEGGAYPPEWGIASRRANFYHFSAPLFPLKRVSSVREVESYPFPDYINEWGHDHLEAEVDSLHRRGYPALGSCQRIFQTAWYLRSREELFIDFYERPSLAEAIFRRVAWVVERMAERLARAGVDILTISDDIAMQDRMMVSPEMWRTWVKPHIAAVFEAARKIKPDLLIAYHSDGDYEPVIPDLLETGVDILSTVQSECMDVVKMKREWGRTVSLMGTIGLQSTLRWEGPAGVRREVRRQIEILGRGGGFLLSPGNAVGPDVPWENLIAFIEAADGK
jgi:uroporphyrinogen decarboxylase